MKFIEISIISLYKKIIKKYWKNESFFLFKKPYENKIYLYSSNNNRKIKIEENFFLIGSFNHRTIIKIYTNEIYSVDIKDFFYSQKLINSSPIFGDINSYPLIYSYKYKNLIEKAIRFIKNNYFKKVVLSRLIKIPFHNFYFKKTFQKLIFSCPNSFISLWYDSDYGFWIGASPELLIKCNDKKLITIALAGTIFGLEEKNKWTKKEIEEHKIVIEYITNFLQTYYSGILSIGKTKTRNLGVIQHLETPISFTFFKKPNYYEILKNMYPTPSICGFPKKKSLDFIQKNEEYNRNFYTGYFGPVNKINMELYLNLRCARIRMDKKEINLYAGSGITIHSDVDKEYLETENKIKNILSKFIFN
ncbi:isochorismate synthase [Blattabacterium sp. (Cryptocercus kyebangensis)]|uniref:chorismate-binding protein n=1 Tax=Blattabacterium sp. (Cryptocercus kyebangensis) TaxID=298656 RepID=UPI000D7C53FE|nr:chorismate-binding protein [Blattabacterium sp. (Cryptocercus kyebangensis)]AWU43636.1 isochorismate synthase [Blattabacterium sp. (Cryptocercus kyebangensis)]